MGQFFDSLPANLIDFIRQQPMFFVASSAKDSRVNCSPKGTDTLRVLSEKTVAYLDITGSGNETAAHIVNGGRVTIMWCSFGEKPLILRLYCRGEVVRPSDARWDDLVDRFPQSPGRRQIILLQVESGQTSCGFGVPKMQLIEQRPDMENWARKKGEEALAEYRRQKNARSIDGLCAL
jgi:hypothetical protein